MIRLDARKQRVVRNERGGTKKRAQITHRAQKSQKKTISR